jgi:lipopolysaccharide biosynthesis glycosyltransferase
MAISFEASAPARFDRAIVFASDAKYTRFALLAAEQIARRHPERDFDICLCSDVMLQAPASLAHHGFRFCAVRTEGAFDGLRLDQGRTEIVYLRLALPAAFAGDYRRLLYYDADIFVQGGDFSAFLDADLGGKILGAVRDNTQWRTPNRRPEQFRRLGLPSRPYFNAGMLMIDVGRFVEAELLERCVAFGRKHREQMIRHDQNLLNGTLQGDWAELAPYWNWQDPRSSMLVAAMEGAHVVHFIGPKQPWGHAGGRLPPRFRDAYRSFFSAHYPDLPPVPRDGLAPHQNRRYLREVLLRHTLAVRSFCDYLDRFETDLTVLGTD